MPKTPKAKRVKPNPGTEHLFDPHTGKMYPPMCRSNVYVALPSCPDPHLIECEVPEDEHPNQPHMARIEASEAFTDGFVGWWDQPVEEGTIDE